MGKSKFRHVINEEENDNYIGEKSNDDMLVDLFYYNPALSLNKSFALEDKIDYRYNSYRGACLHTHKQLSVMPSCTILV